jgi:hypothetical protein
MRDINDRIMRMSQSAGAMSKLIGNVAEETNEDGTVRTHAKMLFCLNVGRYLGDLRRHGYSPETESPRPPSL